MDPDILEKYQGQTDPYSTGSSSSHPGRIDGDIRVRSGILGSIRVLSLVTCFLLLDIFRVFYFGLSLVLCFESL